MADEWIKDKLVSIENKLDRLDGRVDNVDVTLAKQSVILEDHTRRSLANEQHVELLREHLAVEIKPLKQHMDQIHAIFKIIGVIATVVGIASGIIEIIAYFHP